MSGTRTAPVYPWPPCPRPPHAVVGRGRGTRYAYAGSLREESRPSRRNPSERPGFRTVFRGKNATPRIAEHIFCLISDSGFDKTSQNVSFRSYSDSFQSRNPRKCELPHLRHPGNESENVDFAFFDTFSGPGSPKNEARETAQLTELAGGYVDVRRGTPLTDEAVEEWIEEHRAKPEAAVREGPVIVR